MVYKLCRGCQPTCTLCMSLEMIASLLVVTCVLVSYGCESHDHTSSIDLNIKISTADWSLDSYQSAPLSNKDHTIYVDHIVDASTLDRIQLDMGDYYSENHDDQSPSPMLTVDMMTPLSIIEEKLPLGPDPSYFDCRVQVTSMLHRHPNASIMMPNGIECLKNSTCQRPLLVGHRGVGGDFSYLAPENSLSAIRAAFVLGLDGVELDVRHTQDEQLVVIHDDTLSRTVSVPDDIKNRLIHTMNLEEIQSYILLPPPLRSYRPTGRFECDHVPTLQQALTLTRGKLFVDLDLKTDRVDLIVDVLTEMDMLDEVYLSTKQVNLALQARQLNPQVRIQIRPQNLAEIQQQVLLFDRLPEILELDLSLITDSYSRIRDYGTKLFTNVWGMDIQAVIQQEYDVYTQVYQQGADVIQSEMPIAVLIALQRWPMDIQ